MTELDFQRRGLKLGYLDLERKTLGLHRTARTQAIGWCGEMHAWSSYCFKSSPSSFYNSTNKLICVFWTYCLHGAITFIYSVQLLDRSYNRGHTWLELQRWQGTALGFGIICKWNGWEDSMQRQVQLGWLQCWKGAQRLVTIELHCFTTARDQVLNTGIRWATAIAFSIDSYPLWVCSQKLWVTIVKRAKPRSSFQIPLKINLQKAALAKRLQQTQFYPAETNGIDTHVYAHAPPTSQTCVATEDTKEC